MCVVKMRHFTVTFERTLDVSVLAPEDATREEIERIAREEVDIDDFELPDWDVSASGGSLVDVPDAECVLGAPGSYGHRGPVDGALSRIDAVLSDDRDDLVNAADAAWWVQNREPAPVKWIAYGGHRWAVSQACIIREDVMPVADLDEGWLDNVEICGFLTSQARAATTEFDPKFREVLALGCVRQDGGKWTRTTIERDGDVVAVVMPRHSGALRVVDGAVAASTGDAP